MIHTNYSFFKLIFKTYVSNKEFKAISMLSLLIKIDPSKLKIDFLHKIKEYFQKEFNYWLI